MKVKSLGPLASLSPGGYLRPADLKSLEEPRILSFTSPLGASVSHSGLRTTGSEPSAIKFHLGWVEN